MKNPTLLRLAGFGLFGVTFVSPGSIERKDWLLDGLSRSVQIIPDISFTASAFCQETNYPKNSTRLTVEIKHESPDSTTAQPIPVPEISPPIIKPPEPTPVIQNGGKRSRKKEVASRKKADSESPDDLLTNTSTDTSNTINGNAVEHSTIIYTPMERDFDKSVQNELPPTDYIDEAEKVKFIVPILSRSVETGLDEYPQELLLTRIDKLITIANRLNYSGKYAFLLNLGLKSGKKRFFIIDLETRKIITSGLVAHGRGREKFTLAKKYSNRYGSSCSSLGLYKIGASYYGDFGKSFRLIGLEQTNNNALTRAIVLHSMGCIPDEEIDYPICQSEGCPSVSPSFLNEISRIIKQTDKPILLWAFDPTIDENFSP